MRSKRVKTRKLLSAWPDWRTMHLQSADPERCLGITVKAYKTESHHFDKKGNPKGFAYNDADTIWDSILRLLPDETLGELSLSLMLRSVLKQKLLRQGLRVNLNRTPQDDSKVMNKTNPAEQAKQEVDAVLNPEGKPAVTC